MDISNVPRDRRRAYDILGFASMDFYRRLFVSYLILISLLVGVSLAATERYVMGYLDAELSKRYAELCYRTLSQADDFLRNMDRVALHVIADPTLRRIFTNPALGKRGNFFQQGESELYGVRMVLAAINGPSDTVIRISFFTDDDFAGFGLVPYYIDEVQRALSDPSMESVREKTAALGGGRYVPPPGKDPWNSRNKEPMLSVFRLYRDLDRSYGIVQVDQPLARLVALLLPETEGIAVQLTDKDGVVYATAGEAGGGRTFESASDYSGWRLHLTASDAIYARLHGLFRLFFIALGVAALGVGVAGNAALGRRLTLPLYELREHIRSVDLDNMAIALDSKRGPLVVGELNTGFERMFAKLKESMAALIETRESESRAHIAALRSQIDPHFLYNMLSMIAEVAAEDGSDRTELIAGRLARTLRYSTSQSSSEATLEEEFRNLEDYLALMAARYEGLLEYELDLPPPMRPIELPRFILQPIAENCFAHAYAEATPPWLIRVSASCAEERWMISVEDNGVGFSPKARDAISAALLAPLDEAARAIVGKGPGGLGLLNIILRLRLTYGDSAFFALTGDVGRTIVTIGGATDASGLHSRG